MLTNGELFNDFFNIYIYFLNDTPWRGRGSAGPYLAGAEAAWILLPSMSPARDGLPAEPEVSAPIP